MGNRGLSIAKSSDCWSKKDIEKKSLMFNTQLSLHSVWSGMFIIIPLFGSICSFARSKEKKCLAANHNVYNGVYRIVKFCFTIYKMERNFKRV